MNKNTKHKYGVGKSNNREGRVSLYTGEQEESGEIPGSERVEFLSFIGMTKTKE